MRSTPLSQGETNSRDPPRLQMANRLNKKNVTIEEHPDPPPLPDFVAPFNFVLASRYAPSLSFLNTHQASWTHAAGFHDTSGSALE